AQLQVFRNGGGCSGLDVARGHDRVDEPERARAAIAHVAPGEHHGHSFERIDQPRQAHGAAEPRMQAQHDLGKAEPRILDRDAIVASERDLEPAAETIAMDDGDRRRAEMIEAIDHRVRLAQALLHHGGVGEPAKFADVGACDETRWLCGAQHQAFRYVFFQSREHLIELAEYIDGERVGARARLVEREPGDAVVVAGELPVAPGRALPGRRGRGERPQLEIARRKRVPNFTHQRSIMWKREPRGGRQVELHSAILALCPGRARVSARRSGTQGGQTRSAPLPLVGRGWGWGSLLWREWRASQRPPPRPPALRFGGGPPPQGGGEDGVVCWGGGPKKRPLVPLTRSTTTRPPPTSRRPAHPP